MLDPTSFVSAVLSQFVPQLPILAVFITGIVIATLRYSRHPQVSRLTIIGLAVLAVWGVISGMLYALAPVLAYNNGLQARQLGVLYSIVGGIGSLVITGGWICVLIALFGWRQPAATPTVSAPTNMPYD